MAEGTTEHRLKKLGRRQYQLILHLPSRVNIGLVDRVWQSILHRLVIGIRLPVQFLKLIAGVPPIAHPSRASLHKLVLRLLLTFSPLDPFLFLSYSDKIRLLLRLIAILLLFLAVLDWVVQRELLLLVALGRSPLAEERGYQMARVHYTG